MNCAQPPVELQHPSEDTTSIPLGLTTSNATGMCEEHYQQWRDCQCRGFLEIKICPLLFKGCFGPGGDKDKKVVVVHQGICNECCDRVMLEAKEQAKAAAKEDAEAEALSAASASTPSTDSRAGSTFS